MAPALQGFFLMWRFVGIDLGVGSGHCASSPRTPEDPRGYRQSGRCRHGGVDEGPPGPVRLATAPPRCNSPAADSRTPGGGLHGRCRCARPAASTCLPGGYARGKRLPPWCRAGSTPLRAAEDGCGCRRPAFMFLAEGQNLTFEQECPLYPRFLPIYLQVRT